MDKYANSEVGKVVSLTSNLYFKTFEPYKTNTGIVIEDDYALLVDPGLTEKDFKVLADFLKDKKILTFSTHLHWDHILWNEDILKAVSRYTSVSSKELIPDLKDKLLGELRELNIPLKTDDLFKETPLPNGINHIVPWTNHGLDVEVIPIPGHLEGQCALYVPKFKVLFSADTLSPVEIPTSNSFNNFLNYLQDLENLREYVEKSNYIIPGHGYPLMKSEALDIIEKDKKYIFTLCLAKRDLKNRGELDNMDENTLDTITENIKFTLLDERIKEYVLDFHKDNVRIFFENRE